MSIHVNVRIDDVPDLSHLVTKRPPLVRRRQVAEDSPVPLRAWRVNRSGSGESCRVARRRRVLALVFRMLGLDALLAEERVLHSCHRHLCRTSVGKILRADVTERRRGGREAGAQRRPGGDSGAALSVARSGGGRGSRDTGGEGPGRCARSGGGGVAAVAAARLRTGGEEKALSAPRRQTRPGCERSTLMSASQTCCRHA
mmetsp:Transcript_33266/g.106802  ORF Transcript_33266/g.106802 Transcript_33266/m.106802 type:complete len:200 (+) Transcript_33266:274-873(+)